MGNQVSIQYDSREKKNQHILDYFDSVGVSHFQSKMYYGDICNPKNTTVVIERKKDLQEFSGNCGFGHEAFKRELERLDALGGKMYILIEQTEFLRLITEDGKQYKVPWKIRDVNDIKYWISKTQKFKILKKNGERVNVTMQASKMYHICVEWLSKHNIEFVFCNRKESGKKILELLSK